MDYSRTERADRLAAAYVAGTLRGRARQRFESLLGGHPALRTAVRAWEHRLMPLTLTVPPVQPSPQVWKRIQARTAAPAPAVGGWWARLWVWRGLTAVATVAMLSLGLLLALPDAARPPVVVVLAATGGAPGDGGVIPASFVAGISADGQAMVTKPVTPGALHAGHSLELWSLSPAGAPRSLGVISAHGATVVQQGQVLDNTAALAVSLEPAGGSPTGAPTGPVLFVGKL
jgi:anti-sigma-K factor RskA